MASPSPAQRKPPSARPYSAGIRRYSSTASIGLSPLRCQPNPGPAERTKRLAGHDLDGLQMDKSDLVRVQSQGRGQHSLGQGRVGLKPQRDQDALSPAARHFRQDRQRRTAHQARARHTRPRSGVRIAGWLPGRPSGPGRRANRAGPSLDRPGLSAPGGRGEAANRSLRTGSAREGPGQAAGPATSLPRPAPRKPGDADQGDTRDPCAARTARRPGWAAQPPSPHRTLAASAARADLHAPSRAGRGWCADRPAEAGPTRALTRSRHRRGGSWAALLHVGTMERVPGEEGRLL